MPNQSSRTNSDYIRSILELRLEQENGPIPDDLLRQKMEEADLSPEELENARRGMISLKSRGRGFLRHQKWSEAVEEFELLVALDPNGSDNLTALATALWNMGIELESDEVKLRGMKFVDRAVEMNSRHREAAAVMAHMSNYPDEEVPIPEEQIDLDTPVRQRTGLPIPLIVASLLIAVGGLVIFLLTGEVDDEGPTGRDYSHYVKQSIDTSFAETVRSIGKEGSDSGELMDGRYIGLDRSGTIYVAEHRSGRVLRFDRQGNFLNEWSTGSEDPVRSFAVTPDGTVMIVLGGIIRRFNGATGDPLPPFPYADGKGFEGIALRPDGGIVGLWRGFDRSTGASGIVDRLVVIDSAGKVETAVQNAITSHGGNGLGVQIAIDQKGEIYLLDDFSNTIYVFGSGGTFLRSFGESGPSPGDFNAPNAIAVATDGTMYVSDVHGIQRFAPDGTYSGVTPIEGSNYSIAITDRNHLLVAARNRVVELVPRD